MDRVALVLGGGGTIGEALCRRLAGRGFRVAVAGRTAADVERVAAAVDGWPLVLDARRSEEVKAAVAACVARGGRLDAAANCVGSIVLKPAHRTTDDEWQDVIATNLTTAFHLVRASVEAMKEGGSIALVSSAAASIGLANHEAIAAAKAGVEGLARAAAATYASRNIRVNVVAPGLVRTKLSAKITQNPASEKASLAMHGLPRLGEADDVASVLAMLLDSSTWVTGQVWGVDGGLGSVKLSRG